MPQPFIPRIPWNAGVADHLQQAFGQPFGMQQGRQQQGISLIGREAGEVDAIGIVGHGVVHAQG